MSLAKKLLEVQQEIGVLKKGTTNPFFKSKYIDINGVLDVVLPALHKRGVLLTQPLTTVGDNNPALATTFTDTDTGEAITDVIIIPEDKNPQKTGSIVTYYRRYQLTTFLGLGAEDDDANSHVTAPKPNTTRKTTTAAKNDFNM